MSRKFVLIRHAQGLHNVNHKCSYICIPKFCSLQLIPTVQDFSIRDPELTALGRDQCQTLRASLKERFDHIPASDIAVIVSPMYRTMQTASLALDWLAEKGIIFEAYEYWQEMGFEPCDVGRPVEQLISVFPYVNCDMVQHNWIEKHNDVGRYFGELREGAAARGKRCLESLHQRDNKLTFVVSHMGFLRDGVCGWGFANADYRVFEFDEKFDGSAASLTLKQDKSTLRGGLGLSPAVNVPLGGDFEGWIAALKAADIDKKI